MRRWSRAVPIPSPSEIVFRSYAQWETEQAVSPLRLIVVALATAWWVVGLHRTGGPLTPVVVAAGWILALSDLYIVRNLPSLARMLPIGSAVGELVVLTLLMKSLGETRTTLEPLFLISVSGAGIRLRSPLNWAFSFVYALAALPWVGPVMASYVAALGLAQSFVALSMVRRIRRGVRDSLTGLFGREYALLQLDERLTAGSFPFSVALADLDGFKGVNDQFGHPMGDTVLVAASRVLERCIRQDDMTARLGGDEFLILFNDMTAEAAQRSAERIRAELGTVDLGTRDKPNPLRLTVSIGVAEARPGLSAHQIMQEVDIALYRAKATRNAVALFTPEVSAVQAPM